MSRREAASYASRDCFVQRVRDQIPRARDCAAYDYGLRAEAYDQIRDSYAKIVRSLH